MFQKIFGNSQKKEETTSKQVSSEIKNEKKVKPVNLESEEEEEEEKKQVIDKQIPKGHEKFDPKDIDKCPFQQFSKNKDTLPKETINQDIEQNPKPKEKKNKKPKGGCPFMPSENKKNPPLEALNEGYDMHYISPYEYLLEYKGLLSFAFDTDFGKKGNSSEDRQVFNKYPIYLKHSLMWDDENMKKVHDLEIASRFFIYDKFREKANKYYFKNDLVNCQSYYERALSCFKWLEYKIQEEVKKDDAPKVNENGEKLEGEGEEMKVEEIDLEQKKKEEEELKKQKEEDEKLLKEFNITEKDKKEAEEMSKQYKIEQERLKKEYKSKIKCYTDHTVFLKDGEDLTDSQDIDMRKSMLQTIFMLIALAHAKQHHFKIALQAIEDAQGINDKSSQLYFRKSQILSYNLHATLEELEQSKQLIETAIHMKQYEKIFKSEPGILRIMNLSNHEEVYIEQAQYTVKRIHERKQWELQRIRNVLQREQQLQMIEKRMIEEGKIPLSYQDKEEEQKSSQTISSIFFKEENMEFDILKEMVNKYYRAIEFYTETKKPDQVLIARNQLQLLFTTVQEVNYYRFIDFTNKQNALINLVNEDLKLDLTAEKTLKRLNRIKTEKAKEVFESGNYNFDMYKYALDDYFKKRNEEREKLEKQQKEQEQQVDEKPRQGKLSKIVNSAFTLEFALQFILGLIVISFIALFTQDNSLLKELFLAFQANSQSK